MADRTIVLAQNKRHAVRGVTVVNPQEFSAYQEDDDDLTYIVDMSSYLDGATISSVTRTPTGVTVSNTSNTTTRLTQRLKGFGYVDINVTSSSGEVEQFRITIQPRGNSSFFLSSTGSVPQNTAQMWDVVADVTAANIDNGISWIRTQGYYTVGDGGGALYKRAYAAPSHGAYITSNAASSYWELASDQDTNVRQFGAKGDGSTDDTAVFQSAITYCVSGGRPLFVPSGTYFFATASASLDPGVGPFRIVGESAATAILKWDEGSAALNSGSEKHLFKNEASATKGALRFEGLTFFGTLQTALAEGGGNAARLAYYPDVRFLNCNFSHLRRMAIDLSYCGRMIVSGCAFESVSRDACRARDTKHVIIDDNFFNRTGDDCIALHTLSATLETFTPIREGIVITNNVMVNAHTVSILGGRRVLFASNYLHLSNITALSIVSGDGTEGDNALLDIVVQGNIFSDLHTTTSSTATAGNAYISINSDAARSGTAPNDTPPYQYDSGDAAVVRPYNWYETNNNTAANPVPPAKGIVISGNTFGRSKRAAAAFSDYGFGPVLHLGASYDPAMTDAIARPAAGIQISTAPPVGLLISSNRIEHTQHGITFPAPTDNNDFKDVVISGNSIFDFIYRGVLLNSGSFNCDVIIEGNNITGDIYRDSPNSNIDGSYDASDGLPDGVSVGNCTGVVVRNNNFRAVCRPVFTNADQSNIIAGNVVRCGVPSATGFNAANKGVGNVMTGNGRYRYILEDSDPTSGTFGALSSVMASNAASIPTSGWYFRGHIVWNDSPTSGGKVLGWMRLTDGTAHVSGTDWLVMTGV